MFVSGVGLERRNALSGFSEVWGGAQTKLFDEKVLDEGEILLGSTKK